MQAQHAQLFFEFVANCNLIGQLHFVFALYFSFTIYSCFLVIFYYYLYVILSCLIYFYTNFGLSSLLNFMIEVPFSDPEVKAFNIDNIIIVSN